MSTRVEESRRRLAERVTALSEETQRQATRALAVKDAAIAVLGAVGAFLAIRQLAKALSAGKRRGDRRERESAPPPASPRRRSSIR
jgi:hypothetical protein